jgi:chromosomal replication initiator protein
VPHKRYAVRVEEPITAMATKRHQLQLDDDPRAVVLQRAWTAALRTLALRVSKATFESYIRPVRPKSWEGSTVTLAAPSPFACAWLAGRYADEIRNALENALANRVELRFVAERPQESAGPGRGLRVEEGGTSGRQGEAFGSGAAGNERAHRANTPRSVPDWFAPLILDDRLRFETFVVGANSRLAYSASVSAAKSPGLTHNPVLLVGPSGVGKSHLLYAIARRVRDTCPGTVIALVDGESFTYRATSGQLTRRSAATPDLAIATGLLLIDDAQFALGAGTASEELVHIMNELLRSGRQVVLTSDRHPAELQVDERTRTRLEGGLRAVIDQPDLEVRMRIVERLFRTEEVVAPGEVVYLIANGIRSNVRTLHGAVATLLAYCRATGAPFSVETAADALGGHLLGSTPRGWMRKGVSIEGVLAGAADQFGLSPADLRGERLDRTAVRARQVAMYLCRQLTDRGYTEIGRALGGRDHATIKRGVERIRELIETDARLAADVMSLQERLQR